MKVFLNPGHAPGGHPDPGAVNSESGLRECDVALAVGQSAESYLNAAGVATELLQSDSLEEICEAANASDADIFVSIHCNAAEAEEANGTETWACAGSYRGSMLASCIQNQIVDALDTTDRGVKIATPGVNGLYVLTNTDPLSWSSWPSSPIQMMKKSWPMLRMPWPEPWHGASPITNS